MRAPLIALALAGCGGGASDRPQSEETLLLDSRPGGVHAGAYLAVDRAFDEAEGVELTIRRPRPSTDAVRLLRSGRVGFAVLDVHDLALARERGADVVGVMAVVQRPLAAVIAVPDVASAANLEGRRVGVPGAPSARRVLDALVRGAGGDPRRVRSVAVGSQAVQALVGGRVDAVAGSWNVEGVALERRKPGIRQFRVDTVGAPPYPGLVLTVTRTKLEDHRDAVRATIRALQRGYGEALTDPESAVQAMISREEGLERTSLAAQFDAVAPVLAAGVPAYGLLEAERLRAWARWAQRLDVLPRAPDIGRAFDTTLVGPVSRD